MRNTTFRIAKMDCPSEEQMIRMKLADLQQIRKLEFDLPNRRLVVLHADSHEEILQTLGSLDFGTSLVESLAADALVPENTEAGERKLLWQVLSINLFFFGLELVAGFLGDSMGLVADSLDMLADSLVYALALFAVGGTVRRKKQVARAAGYFQLVLAVLGFAEVIRRFLGLEQVPDVQAMVIVSALALAGNGFCLYLLQKSRSREAHLQASLIFTSNDVIINLGVIVAGVGVYLSGTSYPDLLVGTIVFAIVGRGAIRILRLSR